MPVRTTTTKSPRVNRKSSPHSVERLATARVDAPMKKIDVPDEVLQKLAKHARISNFLEPSVGLLWSEAHKRFVLDIKSAIRRAHITRTVLRASKIAKLKKIVSRSRDLRKQLKASDKELHASLVSDDVINVIDGLARDAEGIRRLMKTKTPSKWAIMMRKDFVERLLDAAARAGGQLTLSTSQEEKLPLFKAFDLLIDYLPPELVERRSFATLRLIYDAWLKKDRQEYPRLKNRKNNAKK